MLDIKKIADEADLIVNGYCFTKKNHQIRVLNINHPSSAAVLSEDGEILETNMDDIESTIAADIYKKNCEFMEIS